MDTDLRKLKKLVKLMQKEGVLELKASGIELKLSPSAFVHEDEIKTAQPTQKSDKSEPQTPKHSDEELLFWSSPGFMPEEANQ